MKRSPSKLSTLLSERVEAYALAAGVAATGLLVSAQASEAEVVYTPANVQIAPNTSYAMDLNHDGIIDFTFDDKRCLCWYGGPATSLTVRPAQGASLALSIYTFRVGVLQGGERIPDSRNRFQHKLGQMARIYSSLFVGSWALQTHKYVGLAFRIDGQIHYGWARMTVLYKYQTSRLLVRVEGYAYETEPGKPIVAGDMGLKAGAAPEKPTLGMLAAGAAGLAFWRK